MSQTVVGPGKYICEQNLLSQAGTHIKHLGKTALILGGHTALKVAGPKLLASLAELGISAGDEPVWYGGEVSWSQVERICGLIRERKPDFLIAVGGGKALDTGKAVAYAVNLPLVAVPTIAATCAAASAIAVIYDDEGTFIGISHQAKAPDLVLADLNIICEAPVRYLSAGIGDTLAKWFESKASSQKVQPTAQSRSAVRLAELLYSILLESGKEAIQAVQQKQCTAALENVVDAIMLISGSVSGYGGDTVRSAAAHAIYSGLTIFPQVHHTYHGEIVAFGILAQLAMEKAKAKDMELDREISSEVEVLIRFYKDVNLPTSLAELGIESLTTAEWQRLGEVSVTIEDMANMPFSVTPEMVTASVREADELGRKLRRLC